jgi:hypothetical protein
MYLSLSAPALPFSALSPNIFHHSPIILIMFIGSRWKQGEKEATMKKMPFKLKKPATEENALVQA